eukprot:TRINITY_DN10128_c0_g2_i1.p1 TRINITY_DN10128_c0_g2~~TRINITY_DN10128_c0_g2_i1.p1  ORF type:complete len:209 (-),score=30.70 TRINITY_DN10128_c0_g2_i1:126-752(-)
MLAAQWLAAQHLMKPAGFPSKPWEDSTDSGSCCSDAGVSNASGVSTVARGGSCFESLPATKLEVPVEADSMPKKSGKRSRGFKGTGKSNTKADILPRANGPVSSLRSALRSQGNQIMHDLLPKGPPGVWHAQPAVRTANEEAMMLSVRPPPGLEDGAVQSESRLGNFIPQGVPGAWNAGAEEWDANREVGLHPCSLSTLAEQSAYFSL